MADPVSRRVRPALSLGLVAAMVGTVGAALRALPPTVAQVQTTANDFLQPGTQPGALVDPISNFGGCAFCHAGFDPVTEPGTPWIQSMMAQSARDPMFWAALTIANQDAAESGGLCIRCHSPAGFLSGHAAPADGSALVGTDFEGVNCHTCHRMVDPIFDPSENPAADAGVLAATAEVNPDPHGGQYVIDDQDRRRGPFDLGPSFSYHAWELSPFHQESLLCASCHDVSNPMYERVGGSTPAAEDAYVLGALDAKAPSPDKREQFPLDRTYSEWSESAFAQGPVETGGLFGGNKTAVSSCQDCHMEDASGEACGPGFNPTFRTDLPRHLFNGANTWVLQSILHLDQSLLLYGASEISGLTQQLVDQAIARNETFLAKASSMQLAQESASLRVRVVNNAGHKLPTGFADGRRMWINVRFEDEGGALIDERGAYDPATATLDGSDTKVYEALFGPDAALAAQVGLPAAPSFHMTLANEIYKDNRIPPLGYTVAGFEAVQAQPVGATYADGQHWDDTLFDIPPGAASADVTVYHQTTSREYVEFLRDENTTDSRGQIAYDEWVASGESAPVEMDQGTIQFAEVLGADVPAVSLSAGGQQTLSLTAGGAHAGELYWILGSATGTMPGIPVAGLVVPLAVDGYFLFTLSSPGQPPLAGALGVVGAGGVETATFSLPAGADPTLAGATLWHAGVLVELAGGTVTGVSNAVAVDLVP